MKKTFLFLARSWFLTAALTAHISSSHAVTILSQPTFTVSPRALLSGVLSVKTDEPSRVSVSVTDGISSWKRNFLSYSTNHSLALHGFKFSRTNQITVIVRDKFQAAVTNSTPVLFVSTNRPIAYPVTTLLSSQPELMEPGYTLFRNVNLNFVTGQLIIVDQAGEIVWCSSTVTGSDLIQLENGNLYSILPGSTIELNMLGDTVRTVQLPANLPADTHDSFLTDRNTLLYMNNAIRSYPNYPSSATNASAPPRSNEVNVMFTRVVEMSVTNGPLLKTWDTVDFLDAYRLTYLSLTPLQQGLDTHHPNAITEDPRDKSIIFSMRHQNAAVAFHPSTGALKWIVGPHERWGPAFEPYLLKPVGEPFQWNYAQHAPRITSRGTLMLFDNGNFRAMPFDASTPDSQNYSRAVEYAIDEEKMEIRQVWEYGGNTAETLYSGTVGGAFELPETKNVLITFGNVTWLNHARPNSTANNPSMSRIKEVTYGENSQLVWDLSVFDYSNTNTTYRGNSVYRAHRIPDLYPHPALPVTDLSVAIEGEISRLKFSGDPVRSYSVESATVLGDWDPIGTAVVDEDGIADFVDEIPAGASTERFYRVVTR